jgi:hypothetical protein
VTTEIDRLLATAEFRKNPTATQFLRFIVQETLAGRGDRLKAFTIATLALQRDANFDPQQNSIVRVHATRLRQLLEACNAATDPSQTVRIHLPRGTYQPSFERIAHPPDAETTAPTASATNRESVWRTMLDRPLRQPALYALIGVLLSLVFAATWTGPASRDPALSGKVSRPIASRPRMSVTAQIQPGAAAPAMRTLLSSVENAISAFDHITVTTSDRAPPIATIS